MFYIKKNNNNKNKCAKMLARFRFLNNWIIFWKQTALDKLMFINVNKPSNYTTTDMSLLDYKMEIKTNTKLSEQFLNPIKIL
jgi:hypothetical protein